MRPDAALANAAWFASALPAWRRFRRATHRVEAVQRATLQRYLEDNAGTAYGQQYGFAAIRSWEDWAAGVPLCTYEDLAPWLERIIAGEQGVLTAGAVRLLEPTSGSTGPQKFVPYTDALRREFREAVAAWITALMREQPSLMAGRAYWSLTPNIDVAPLPDSSIPIGFDDDSAYLGGIAQRIIRRTLIAGPNPQPGRATDEFWRETAGRLVRARDLRLISAWHPTFVAILLQHVADIDARPPAQIWPRLGLVSCWGDGHAATYLAELRQRLPGVRIQPKGLLATEGVVTFPVGDRHPLALTSHFYEFIGSDGAVRPAWDLDVGSDYEVVITTGGGLYRYRLQDAVRVTGHVGAAPCLRFLGKASNVSDLCGEKLAEPFVAAALAKACAAIGIEPHFIMIAPETSPPRYCLFVDSPGTDGAALGRAVDAELARNPHYALCRRLGQLAPIDARHVPRAHARYCDRLQAAGMRLGDIKPAPLSRLPGWSDWFADQQAAPRQP